MPQHSPVDTSHWLAAWLNAGAGVALQKTAGQLQAELLQDAHGLYQLVIGCDLMPASHQVACIKHCFFMPSGERQHAAGELCACSDALPFPEASLDIVVLSFELELAAQPKAVLAEVSRVLVPNGLVLITGLNPLSLLGVRRMCSPGKNMLRQCNFLHPARLVAWLRDANFSPEQTKIGSKAVAGAPAAGAPADMLMQIIKKTATSLGVWAPGAVYTVSARKQTHGFIFPKTRRGTKIIPLTSPSFAERVSHRPLSHTSCSHAIC